MRRVHKEKEIFITSNKERETRVHGASWKETNAKYYKYSLFQDKLGEKKIGRSNKCLKTLVVAQPP